MSHQRIQYIDQIKGFAIFLVVFAHAIGWNLSNWQQVLLIDYSRPCFWEKSLLWSIIYSFHMPLFFFISGLFTPPICKSTMKDYILKKTRRLLLPYIVTGFLMILARGYYGYWFLFSLWETSLLGIIPIVISHSINKKNSVLVDIGIFGVMYIVLRYCLNMIPATPFAEFDRCLFSLPCFFLGIIVGKHKLLDKLNSKSFTFLFFIFVLSFIIRYLPFIVDDSQLIYKIVGYVKSLLTPIAATLLVTNLFKLGISEKVGNLRSLLGKKSLHIYILHVFFVIQLPVIGEFIIKQNGMTCVVLQLIYSFMIATIAIILSLLVAGVLQRSRLLQKICFGS